MITINALATADSMIILVQAHYLPAKGITQLMKTINKVKRQINPALKVGRVLLTLMDGRTTLARQRILCGGQDLIFPHHENEIAQSECCNGVPFANYWMHNGYINVDNVKMSESLGNFFTVRDVAEKYGYEPIRYPMISSQYRSPINYSVQIIEQCKASLTRLYNCAEALDFALENASDGVLDEALARRLDQHRQDFIDAMDDDLNTANGLACIFELVCDINKDVLGTTASRQTVEHAKGLLMELCDVLGLLYNKKDTSLDTEVEKLIEERNQARKEKNWARADAIRDELKSRGIVIEDTPQGVKWHVES